jgi:ENTS family enterobactin (siderophore) exporter
MVPRVLDHALLPAANALTSASYSLATVVGPLLAGLLVERYGVAVVLTLDAVLLLAALASLARLPALPPLEVPAHRAGLPALVAGLRLLRSWPNVRMTFVLDVVAMVTCFPRALFPAVGLVVLGGGAETAGALLAAFAAGSLAASVLSGSLGRVHRHGRAIAWAITAWGASIGAFGLVLLLAPPPAPGAAASAPWASPWLWAALAALAAAGAADAVSAVHRQSVLQQAAPDASRGLLAGVFIVVVAGGPRLGEAVSGALAARVGEAVVPLVGGLACIALVAALVARHRSFWRYDARRPVP